MDVWPFLVTRNRKVDYRTVVAPGFLADAKVAGTLAQLASGSPGTGPQTKPWDSPVGPLTLYYHVVPATLDGERLLDAHGRAVLFVVGVVVKGATEGGELEEAVLERAQAEVMRDFSTFWRSDSPLGIFRSSGLPIASDKPSLVRAKRWDGPTRQVLIGTGGLVLLALALAVAVRQTRMILEHQKRMQSQLDSLQTRMGIVEARTSTREATPRVDRQEDSALAARPGMMGAPSLP